MMKDIEGKATLAAEDIRFARTVDTYSTHYYSQN